MSQWEQLASDYTGKADEHSNNARVQALFIGTAGVCALLNIAAAIREQTKATTGR